MASIYERKYASGVIVYRMVFCTRGYPIFCLTFDTLESACDFAETHEKKYRDDPDSYFAWREQKYYLMKKNGERVLDGLIIPKMFPKKKKKENHDKSD